MMLAFCLVLSLFIAIIPHFLWFIGWIVGRIVHYNIPYHPFGWSAMILVVIFWALMAYGYYIGRWRVHTTALEYSHKEIPHSFDNFRIVHISDLHLSTFDDQPQQLERIVDLINSQCPDLVCFTGDLVTVGKSEAEPYTSTLKRISATHGVAAVLGNHDFLIYNYRTEEEKRENEVTLLEEYIREKLGWNLLRNQSVEIRGSEGDKITILGIDNIKGSGQGFSTIDRGEIKKAAEGTEGFRILLSHDPSFWETDIVGKTEIPLTLSGHTHAAQIRVFGWTPSSLMFSQTDGRYDIGGQTLYVNIGLGCTAPFRLGANPEITVITLKTADNDR